MLSDAQRQRAAAEFAEKWANRAYEKGNTHSFWLELCAQAVRDARDQYEGVTLADLYDPDNSFLSPPSPMLMTHSTGQLKKPMALTLTGTKSRSLHTSLNSMPRQPLPRKALP